jgi:hypothetical protein
VTIITHIPIAGGDARVIPEWHESSESKEEPVPGYTSHHEREIRGVKLEAGLMVAFENAMIMIRSGPR